MNEIFVLIHSPLTGPLTWSPVARILGERGVEAMAPRLDDDEMAGIPFWQQNAASLQRAVQPLAPDRPLILVGHSGAGPILPALRAALERPVAGYIFVDAGIPRDGKSYLDLIEEEDAAFAAELRKELVAGGRFPQWSDEDLREIIPDDQLGREAIAELRPRGLAYFEEPLPVFAGWPDAPCAYLLFSPVYAVPAERARLAGWAYREMAGGHFHMLVDPAAAAEVLLELAGAMSL